MKKVIQSDEEFLTMAKKVLLKRYNKYYKGRVENVRITLATLWLEHGIKAPSEYPALAEMNGEDVDGGIDGDHHVIRCETTVLSRPEHEESRKTES